MSPSVFNLQTIKNSIWLMGGIGCLFVATVFWAISDQDELIEMPIAAVEQQASTIQGEKVRVTAQLGTFQDEVAPLDVSRRNTVAGQHGPEFRGAKFIQEHGRSWTLELLRSSDEEIIKVYLSKQENRKNFQYFRLNEPGKSEQFVLSYGRFNSAADALKQLEQSAFGLPDSVVPVSTRFSAYEPFVNDLGADEMRTSSKLYQVSLKAAPLPKLEAYRPSSSSEQNTTQTQPSSAIPDPFADTKPATTTPSTTAPKVEQPVIQQKIEPKQEREIIDPFA